MFQIDIIYKDTLHRGILGGVLLKKVGMRDKDLNFSKERRYGEKSLHVTGKDEKVIRKVSH